MSSISSFIASYSASSLSLSRTTLGSTPLQQASRIGQPRVVDDGSSRQQRDREQIERPNRLGALRSSLGPGLGLGSFRSLLPRPNAGAANGNPGQPFDRAIPPRTNPQPAPTDGEATSSSGSLEDRLKELDPKLQQQLQSLRDLLERFSPEAAKSLDELIGKIVGHLDELQGGGGEPTLAPGGGAAPGGSTEFRFQQIEIAVERSVTDIEIKSADGTTITAQVVRESFSLSFAQVLGKSDPLVLDLNGNGQFDTTSAADGALFDITGDGLLEQAATAANGDGFLALDRNGNGQIDSGAELFGDQNGAANGFEELRKFDGNFDGRIDIRDSIFPQLQVYNDINRNGQTDVGELKSLRELQIAALLIDSTGISEQTNGGEAILSSSFIRNDGSQQRLGDLLLNYLA